MNIYASTLDDEQQQLLNQELNVRLVKLLQSIWAHMEIERDDMKLLCWGCGIDSRTITGDEPITEISDDKLADDMQLPF